MTREARLNIIFITFLILATLPGAVILFKKKMQPGATSNAEPEIFLKQTAYMDPVYIPNFSRVVPPLTVKWVEQITGTKMINPPIMSQQRTYQLVNVTGLQNSSAGTGVLVVWNINALSGRAIGVTTENHTLDVLSQKKVELPHPIREELQRSGFVNPPHDVIVATFRIPPADHLPTRIAMLGDLCDLSSLGSNVSADVNPATHPAH